MDKTIDMANEAGGILLSDSEIWGLGYEFELYQLKAFEALVRADEREIEREACAKVCDEQSECWGNISEHGGVVEQFVGADKASMAEDLAAAIRARGKT